MNILDLRKEGMHLIFARLHAHLIFARLHAHGGEPSCRGRTSEGGDPAVAADGRGEHDEDDHGSGGDNDFHDDGDYCCCKFGCWCQKMPVTTIVDNSSC